MIITLILIVIFGIALAFNLKDDDLFWPELVMIFSGILLVLNLIIWPIVYYDTLAEAHAIKAMQVTVDHQRAKDMTEYERATMTNSIIEANRNMAKLWRLNNVILFDSYISDEIMDVDYID